MQDACAEFKDGLWPHAVEVVTGLIEEYLEVEETFLGQPHDKVITQLLSKKKMDTVRLLGALFKRYDKLSTIPFIVPMLLRVLLSTFCRRLCIRCTDVQGHISFYETSPLRKMNWAACRGALHPADGACGALLYAAHSVLCGRRVFPQISAAGDCHEQHSQHSCRETGGLTARTRLSSEKASPSVRKSVAKQPLWDIPLKA